MRWIRSWPAEIPPGRSHVVDGTERAVMDGYDYRPVLEKISGAVIIAEWDIALGPEDMQRFEAACAAQRSRVHVAPYRLYPRSTGLADPVWAHRNADGTWIGDGQPVCDLFSLGLAYLPGRVIRKHLGETAGAVTDDTLSRWHHASRLGPVAVHWDVHVTHLHY